ncbi:MAG: YybH family protein [Gemmatimonadales bacterium]
MIAAFRGRSAPPLRGATALARVLATGLAATLACSSGGGGTAAPVLPAPAALTAEFEAQFRASAAAWNSGDLDAFMADYARDSLTSYMGGRAPVYGWSTIRGHYEASFRPGARRDSLRFEGLAARALTPTLALVTARFILHRGDSVTASGPFTLVMERRPDGWKILHDHTSTDPR